MSDLRIAMRARVSDDGEKATNQARVPGPRVLGLKVGDKVCTSGGNPHRLDLPDMNQIGLLEQQEELRRLSQVLASTAVLSMKR